MSVSPFVPLREVPDSPSLLKSGDTLVLVGELFTRGYANGLVEAAQKRGIRVIQATVGRRDEDDILRPLTHDELKMLPFDCVNIPLEAGFDYERAQDGLHLIDRLKYLKLQDWQSFYLEEDLIEESRKKARSRLLSNMLAFCEKIEEKVPTGNIVFAHLMAGGVPRSKYVLAILNRTVKGTGEKFFSSRDLWNSNLGRIIAANFHEVTAHSFKLLLDASQELRERFKKSGRQVGYTAYGYHGTEVFIGNSLKWQTYTPYLQGWAKIDLENFAIKARFDGIAATVYNCPEILTNSSSIFQGVEIPLYALITAFDQIAPHHKVTEGIKQICQSRLKPGVSLAKVREICEDALTDQNVAQFFEYQLWPSHNSLPQLSKILDASEKLIACQSDLKHLITADLSEVVLKACGEIMLSHIGDSGGPVVWLGHDVIAKSAIQ